MYVDAMFLGVVLKYRELLRAFGLKEVALRQLLRPTVAHPDADHQYVQFDTASPICGECLWVPPASMCGCGLSHRDQVEWLVLDIIEALLLQGVLIQSQMGRLGMPCWEQYEN